MFEIYYDDLQEGMWFKSLNPSFGEAVLHPITGASSVNPALAPVLKPSRYTLLKLGGSGKIRTSDLTLIRGAL